MIAFGRARLSLVAAAAALVAFAPSVPDPDGARLAAGAPPPSSSTTTTTGSTSTTSTTSTSSPTSTTTGPGPTTASTAASSTTTARGGATTTTAASSTTSGPETTTTTARATTTTQPPCPVGGLAWTVSFKGSRDGDAWLVSVSGEITNESDAAVEVGPITTTIETSPPSGSSQPREVQVESTMATTTLAPGAAERFSGTRRVESTTNPKQGATVVGRRWADPAVRDRCPPP